MNPSFEELASRPHHGCPVEMRRLRLVCGCTQREWAKKLRVSEKQVRRWESGTAPAYDYRTQIACEVLAGAIVRP